MTKRHCVSPFTQHDFNFAPALHQLSALTLTHNRLIADLTHLQAQIYLSSQEQHNDIAPDQARILAALDRIRHKMMHVRRITLTHQHHLEAWQSQTTPTSDEDNIASMPVFNQKCCCGECSTTAAQL